MHKFIGETDESFLLILLKKLIWLGIITVESLWNKTGVATIQVTYFDFFHSLSLPCTIFLFLADAILKEY